MMSRSSEAQAAEPSPSTQVQEENIFNQIREHLIQVTEFAPLKSTIGLYSCKCGIATFSKSKHCWKIHHNKFLPGSSESVSTPIAELHVHHDNRANPQILPLPPAELVQSILMCQELKSWLDQARDALKRGSTEGDAAAIANNPDLSFEVRPGEWINFGAFIAMIDRKDQGRRIMSQILSLNHNTMLWKRQEYKGWKVPEVLFSGNFPEIEKWRERKAYERTKQRRPDLLED